MNFVARGDKFLIKGKSLAPLMNDMTDQLIIAYASQSELEKKLVELLSGFGYSVTKSKWYRIDDLAKHLQMATATCHARLRRYMQRHPVRVKRERYGRGRIMEVAITPELERELRRPVQKRKNNVKV